MSPHPRSLSLFFFSLRPRPPSSTLFPYTTLFRSDLFARVPGRHHLVEGRLEFRELVDEIRVVREERGEGIRSEEHTSELQSHSDLVCRLLLEKKNKHKKISTRGRRKSRTCESQ